jgi:hypothetical protein
MNNNESKKDEIKSKALLKKILEISSFKVNKTILKDESELKQEKARLFYNKIFTIMPDSIKPIYYYYMFLLELNEDVNCAEFITRI